jgi:uncharacterized protein
MRKVTISATPDSSGKRSVGPASDRPRIVSPPYMNAFRAENVLVAMRAYRGALVAHRATINRLNVFPVPDGDTGTNMSLTADAVVDEIESRLAGPPASRSMTMAVVCEAIAHGSLMGARGNSGVILCQVLRGLATTFAPLDSVGPHDLAAALESGSAGAWEAVLRPVEGTILSVAARAAEAARSAAMSRRDLIDTLEVTRAAAVEALWKTPTQLDVLAEAGVVDAGGAGLVLLYDAFLCAADGRAMPDALELPESVARLVAAGAPLSVRPAPGDVAASGLQGSISPRYEVMFLLSADDALIPALKDVWAGIGDSIVVVGGDGLWNCHVHTDEIGAAIDAGLDVGRPRDIRVSDLAGQVEEERWVREAPIAATEVPPTSEEGAKSLVVVVANGEGIERIFHSLGVRHIVEGGQSMNPSTRELLDAIESTPADEVVVLPNNANIIPVARQAAALSPKKVRVVPTEGIQEGFAALLEYDPGASGEENADAMARASSRVVAGEVTRAVRSTTSSVGDVQVGDYIGLSRGGIEAVAKTLADATIGLLQALVRPEHEIVTLLQGDGATSADTRRVTEWLAAEHPDVSVELHHGGQPLYPYLVSIE